MQERVENTSRRFDKLRDDETAAKDEAARIGRELSVLESELSGAMPQLTRLQSEATALRKELEKYSDLSVIKAELKSQNEAKETFEEHRRLRESESEILSKAKDEFADCSKLREVLTTKEDSLKGSCERLARAVDQNETSLASDFPDLKIDAVSPGSDAAAQLERQLREMESRRNDTQSELLRLEHQIKVLEGQVERATEMQYTLTGIGDSSINRTPLFTDPKSKMRYFFGVFPLEYLHHDDRINPRSIGGSLKGLLEEFYAGRPQLHVSLGWWAPNEDGQGPLKIFDGQHKAAAQILLGVKQLPIRVFIEPDTKVLLQANTNAGDTLRQVAFDMAVKRHLGSALYKERLTEYREAKKLNDDDESFSEQDLVSYFKGSRREMQKYILDSVRNAITHDPDNRLMEFVELAGKSAERPLSYSAIEKTFFSIFLYLKPLTTPLNYLDDEGKNPRHLEHTQMVRLMNLYSDEVLTGRWDPEESLAKLEYKIQQGEAVSQKHLCAHRMSREEILHATLMYVEKIIKNHYAYTAEWLDEDRLLQVQHPEALWDRIKNFLVNLRGLPCWIDRNLSGTVFGAKQNRDFWIQIFKSGFASTGTRVLTEPLDIQKMIQTK